MNMWTNLTPLDWTGLGILVLLTVSFGHAAFKALTSTKGPIVFRKKRPTPAVIRRRASTTVSVRAADATFGHLTLQDLRNLVRETRDWPGNARVDSHLSSIDVTRADPPNTHR